MSEQSKVRMLWPSLDILRKAAFAGGCTAAQFAHAIEAVGGDPQHVAPYLQRRGFFKSPREMRPFAGDGTY